MTTPSDVESFDPSTSVGWILSGIRRDGHIASATGFGKVAPVRIQSGQWCDELGVVGWCDKAFAALSILLSHSNQPGEMEVMNYVSAN